MNGTEPKIHGHKENRASKAMSLSDIENVVKFIKKYVLRAGGQVFFLGDLPFSPNLPIDWAQKE